MVCQVYLNKKQGDNTLVCIGPCRRNLQLVVHYISNQINVHLMNVGPKATWVGR
jgi:hypothetical protein